MLQLSFFPHLVLPVPAVRRITTMTMNTANMLKVPTKL